MIDNSFRAKLFLLPITVARNYNYNLYEVSLSPWSRIIFQNFRVRTKYCKYSAEGGRIKLQIEHKSMQSGTFSLLCLFPF